MDPGLGRLAVARDRGHARRQRRDRRLADPRRAAQRRPGSQLGRRRQRRRRRGRAEHPQRHGRGGRRQRAWPSARSRGCSGAIRRSGWRATPTPATRPRSNRPSSRSSTSRWEGGHAGERVGEDRRCRPGRAAEARSPGPMRRGPNRRVAFTMSIDTGGTFTDGFVSDGARTAQVKVDTTPHDLTIGFQACLEAGAAAVGHELTGFLRGAEPPSLQFDHRHQYDRRAARCGARADRHPRSRGTAVRQRRAGQRARLPDRSRPCARRDRGGRRRRRGERRHRATPRSRSRSGSCSSAASACLSSASPTPI